MSKFYPLKLKLVDVIKQDLVCPKSYSGSISTKYSFLDEHQMFYPTGLTLIASQILPADDFYYNLIHNCARSSQPLSTYIVSYRRSFQYISNKILTLQSGGVSYTYPLSIQLQRENIEQLRKLIDDDSIHINSEPPLRICELIKLMEDAVKNWCGIFFIDDLNSFIYDSEEDVLEQLYRFSSKTQRAVIIRKRTISSEGEYDSERGITFLNTPILEVVCNHQIYLGWKNDPLNEPSSNQELSLFVQSNKDSGCSKFSTLYWNPQTGVVSE